MCLLGKSSLFPKVISVVASAALTLSSASSPAREAPTPVARKVPATMLARQNSPSMPTATQMPMVFPLFIQNLDFSSTLVLTSAASQPTYADVVLNGLDGREIAQRRVQFTPHSQRSVEVSSLLASAVSRATTGSITVMQPPEFDGTMVILGQLSMTYCASDQPTSMIGVCQEGKNSPDALRRSAGVSPF